MSRFFNSTSTHLDASSVPVGITSVPLTLSAWIKMSSLGNSGYILTIGVAGSAFNKFDIRINASNVLLAEACDASTCGNATSVAAIADTTTWHLVTGVFTANNSRAIYLDGANKITNAVNKVPTIAITDAMRICNSLDGFNPMQGNIAYVATWSMALSDSDVAALMFRPPDQIQPGSLVDRWGLLYNDSPETDIGPANVSLTVNGAPTFSTDNPALSTAVMPWITSS